MHLGGEGQGSNSGGNENGSSGSGTRRTAIDRLSRYALIGVSRGAAGRRGTGRARNSGRCTS